MNYIIATSCEDNFEILINIDQIVSIVPIGTNIEPICKITTTQNVFYVQKTFNSIIRDIHQTKRQFL